jgi:hypothetical protein
MRTRRLLGLAIVLLAFVPGSVAAGDLCACNDGQVVQTMEEGEHVCEQACSEMGGGESMQQSNPNAGTAEDEARAVRESGQKPSSHDQQPPGPNRKP